MCDFRCGGLNKNCPEFICPSHSEGRTPVRAGESSSFTNETIGGTTEVLDILSERSESPKSTDSDDDHIVEAAIRYSEAKLHCPPSILGSRYP